MGNEYMTKYFIWYYQPKKRRKEMDAEKGGLIKMKVTKNTTCFIALKMLKDAVKWESLSKLIQS